MEHNDEALRLNLDLLDEKREQVQRRAEEYQSQRVKPRSYMPGDLVLKNLLPSRKNPAHGKLGPTGKATTSYLESSGWAIMSSKQRREKFYNIHGMRSIFSVSTSRHQFVILNKALSILI